MSFFYPFDLLSHTEKGLSVGILTLTVAVADASDAVEERYGEILTRVAANSNGPELRGEGCISTTELT